MRPYGVLILFGTLSAASALRCYTCTATESKSCTDTKSCAVIFDRCFSLKLDGFDVVTKGCQNHVACGGTISCCEGNLCNGTLPTIPSVILLLVLSATTTLFL
ncbi:prostate stem cell antigen-like [Odontesthes bonariensis]|uniref:prostate stem cell antigen-like n=1 Tax=Odontesthes bonariensis TaxID=219752 RepID=UPI003F58B100